MSALNDILLEELEQIRTENDGILKPEDVVEAAVPKTSPLHHYFEWNDGAAGIKYRLWQARQLITTVTVVYPDQKPTQIYVSVISDRHHGGGYRHITEVMNDEKLRKIALKGAYLDYQIFEAKYRRLSELSTLFEQAREVFQQLGFTEENPS